MFSYSSSSPWFHLEPLYQIVLCFLQDKLTDEKIHNFIDVLSDTMFNYCVDETARLRLGLVHK